MFFLSSSFVRQRSSRVTGSATVKPWLIGAAALALAGCAQLTDPPADYTSAYASDVFEAGYSYISDRYIEPVSLRQLVLAGLDDLSELDETLTIVPQARTVEVSVPETAPISIALPTNTSAQRWADVSVRVIDTARQLSPTVQEATTEELFELVFDGALTKLDDFSRYSGADDAADARALREGFGGIGLTVRMEDDFALVLSVVPGAPADRAGLLAEDRIVMVNGEAVAGWTQRQLIRTLRGRINTTVHLTIDRPESTTAFDLALRRQRIVPPTVVATREGSVAVLKVASFNQRTARNVKKHITSLRREPISGVVLDLRDNPGGLLDQAVEVADIFLDRGRIVGTRGRHPHSQQTYAASGSDLSGGLPLVILVNGNTASASEVVAAALQDQQRAVVIGTNSYGKGTVQTVYRLPNDGELTLTWSRLHPPSGYRLHGLGVLPAVCSNLGSDAVDVVDVLEQARTTGVEDGLRNAWQSTDTNDQAVLEPLRSACPSATAAPKTDLEVAQGILEDPVLFSRMLRSRTTVIAHRPDELQ